MNAERLALALLLVVTAAACTETETESPPSPPRATAKLVTDSADLIGGPLAEGRLGDYLIANPRLRAIIRKPGRDFSFLLTYGGNIIDADVVRAAGEPGRDNFGAMTPLINVSSTTNVTEITVINDGANGEPAVIRTLGVDDLFDPIDPANAIKFLGGGVVALPASAIDNNIPVEIRTEYSLGVDDEAIRIETSIANTGTEPLTIYVGDYVNGSGELDNFIPSFGFGEILFRPSIPYLAYVGVGDATGVTYGIVPEPMPGTTVPTSGFGQSGFFAYLLNQDILQVLLTGQPGIVQIPPAEERSYVRYFVVTDGDAGSIAAVQQHLVNAATGTVEGHVTVAGEPVAGALVSVVQKPGELNAPYNVVTSLRTDDDGHYTGSVAPGDYSVIAKVPGHPYDSNQSLPTEHPVTIHEGLSSTVDVDVAAAGRLAVNVTDGHGNALPAKVTVVGFDPAPDPLNRTTFAILSINGFVFSSNVEQKGADLFGLTAVYFADQTGTIGEASLPPGQYQIVITRGPEYSAHRELITISSAQTTAVAATLVHVVDPVGFVATDHHVHLINSLDSAVTRDDRIRTMAAEGVEYFVATDHDFLTDLRGDVQRLGLDSFVKAGIGSEITTFNLGHFNAYPLLRDPDRVAGAPIDWGRAPAVPGMGYPSDGSYDLSPGEVFAAARNRFDGPDGAVQINHFNSGTLGYFQLANIDTAEAPPQSSTDASGIRQNPTIANLYDDGYDALELWIEGSRSETALATEANFGDWFNLLNQGRIKTGMADSDTHTTAIVQAGGPRTYLASSTDDPAELTDAELARSVINGQAIATNGPFLHVIAVGVEDRQAGLAFGQSNLLLASDGGATLLVKVQSPDWAPFDEIAVYVSTVPTPVDDGTPVARYAVAPARTLVAGTDFEVRQVTVTEGDFSATRLETDLQISVPAERDAWVVVTVKGSDGVSPPLWPMNPQDLNRESNQTLAQLTDGNLGEGGQPAFAFTNPIFLDVDGNGRFDPLFARP